MKPPSNGVSKLEGRPYPIFGQRVRYEFLAGMVSIPA